MATVGRDAWVTVLPGRASHRGGTLRLALPAADVPYSPDPTQFSGPPQWQLLSLTNDGLVTYRKVGGLAGAELVPDLATAIPEPTDGGLTYTFTLRDGIRYSNGATLRPDDIRRGIERTMRSGNPYLADQYAGIVGAARCRPRACELRHGIVTDREAGSVTFHLTRPDPDFLYKLAFAMASAVPDRDVRRQGAAGDRAVHDGLVHAAPRVGAGAKPAVPRVVARRAARGLPGPDRPEGRTV